MRGGYRAEQPIKLRARRSRGKSDCWDDGGGSGGGRKCERRWFLIRRNPSGPIPSGSAHTRRVGGVTSCSSHNFRPEIEICSPNNSFYNRFEWIPIKSDVMCGLASLKPNPTGQLIILTEENPRDFARNTPPAGVGSRAGVRCLSNDYSTWPATLDAHWLSS